MFNKNSKKNDTNKNKLIRDIKIVYNIGSKSHEKQFEAYALFGAWMVKNWRGIKIVDISLMDEEKSNGNR